MSRLLDALVRLTTPSGCQQTQRNQQLYHGLQCSNADRDLPALKEPPAVNESGRAIDQQIKSSRPVRLCQVLSTGYALLDLCVRVRHAEDLASRERRGLLQV